MAKPSSPRSQAPFDEIYYEHTGASFQFSSCRRMRESGVKGDEENILKSPSSLLRRSLPWNFLLPRKRKKNGLRG